MIGLGGVRVARSLVFVVVFCRPLFVRLLFTFGHYASVYSFDSIFKLFFGSLELTSVHFCVF